MIRQPIICVMGHVDHGKTTLLDKIRNSSITAKEAGGITQHIGASEVPLDVINKICKGVSFGNSDIKIPGLLFIDTPGHEAFTNLRRRGSSVADLAILVVDITQGFQPQTVEAITILKEYKTPFIVAANKVDLITGWRPTGLSSIAAAMKKQDQNVLDMLETKIYELIGSLSKYGFGGEIYNKVENFQKELAIVPISAKSGEGLAELLMLAVGLSQKFLELKLNIEANGPGRGSVIEKKELKGMGTTIDVILYDGSLHVNDVVAFAKLDGSIATTKIKALLKPKPLHELVESASKFYNVDSVSAASGIKISALGLEDAMPGTPIIEVTDNNYEKEIGSELTDVFKTDSIGIVLKTDSIGSLEALSKLLASEGAKISKKGIGNVTKRDVIDAFAMNAVDPVYSVVLSFNVHIDADAEAALEASNVKYISSNIIYKLVDDYKLYIDTIKHNRLAEIAKRVTLPAEIEILPNSCFRVSHPAIFGVEVKAGTIKPGIQIINEEGDYIGKLKGVQNDGVPLESAKKGESVAVSMDEPTFGRQIREGQKLYARLNEFDVKTLNSELSGMLNEDDKVLMEKTLQLERKRK
jgi:translation initiation factor 5B